MWNGIDSYLDRERERHRVWVKKSAQLKLYSSLETMFSFIREQFWLIFGVFDKESSVDKNALI